MQTLVAYAFDREPDEADVAVRLGRVAEHYARIWQAPIERSGVARGRCGLYLWDGQRSPCRWPSWQEEEDLVVATLYTPLGYEAVIGDAPFERAPILLARALIERPWAVLDLTAPFVIASLSPSRGGLRVHTDGMGLGRVFEVRYPGGWVWSNRPAAACRFAGIRAEADRDGWRTFASTGWFLGERTSFARVFSVPGGTSIGYDIAAAGRTQSRVDALASWSADRPCNALAHDRIDEVAEALKCLVSSLFRVWDGKVVADLSGGRDSRLVVAAAIAAGLELTVRTNGAEPGEADVAERLIARLPAAAARRVVHRVTRPASSISSGGGLDAPPLQNALGWHRCQEGLRPATYLSTRAPAGLIPARDIIISGGGGEIAHGHYYPEDYAEIERLPSAERVDAFVERLERKILRRVGPSTAAKATAAAHVRRILEEVFAHGISDSKMLDYFYAAERLRRWGSAAEMLGRVSPLLVPAFVRAAFDSTPEQRRGSELHKAVTVRLVPEWKDEPYYRRPRGFVAPTSTPPLGSGPDREAISAIVADSGLWADAFDPEAVRASWRRLLEGRGAAQDEGLLQRVCWLSTFTDYLGEVNGDDGTRIARSDPSPRRRQRSVGRGRRFAARALRRAARFVEERA